MGLGYTLKWNVERNFRDFEANDSLKLPHQVARRAPLAIRANCVANEISKIEKNTMNSEEACINTKHTYSKGFRYLQTYVWK